jgi:DNA-binding transcriptional MerR regulator
MKMNDPLSDIRHYSPTMTISQVIKFCEKKQMSISRAMIQNYIRAGLLPPPRDKRFYTHKHLAVLAMTDCLKTVFDIPTIQKALSPHMDDEGLSLDIYAQLMDGLKNFSDKWNSNSNLFTMACAAELKRTVEFV